MTSKMIVPAMTQMTPQLKNLMILLGAIIVVLLVVIILFSGKSPFRRFISFFIEDEEEANARKAGRANRRHSDNRGMMAPNGRPMPSQPQEDTQKSTSEPIVEMATLVRKSDDRQRIIESSGQVRITDEYYELNFITRKGKKLRIECSAEAYEKIPFNQQGSLTYKRNMLVKFKYYGDTVYN